MITRADRPARLRPWPATAARRLLAGGAIAALLALVFAAYLRPGFALDLANRFILCL